MLTITRRLEFDAGHRLLGHEGQCKYLHGHRYRVLVTVAPIIRGLPELDPLGRVIDFSCLKSLIGGWIDENWDHNMILHPNDPLLIEAGMQPIETAEHYLKRIMGRLPFVMPDKLNPTAENLARYLFWNVCFYLLPDHLRVVRVRIYETPNCYADAISERADEESDSPR